MGPGRVSFQRPWLTGRRAGRPFDAEARYTWMAASSTSSVSLARAWTSTCPGAGSQPLTLKIKPPWYMFNPPLVFG